MAIGFGKGSEANVPLARAVVGGLLTSTFLTLVVVPILYTLLMREKREADFDLDAELEGRAVQVQSAFAVDGSLADGNGAQDQVRAGFNPSLGRSSGSSECQPEV